MKKIKNDIKLIFAVGNPENEYKNTRHNVGIFFLKSIIKKLNIESTYKKKLNSYVSNYKDLAQKNIYIVISNAYMNNSGECLLQIMNYYKIKSEEILVIQDEMSLDCSEIFIKFNGSSHGHNGIKDIIQKINTDKFYKLKIGIGKPKYRSDNIRHVLSKFENCERDQMKKKIKAISLKIEIDGLLQTIENLKI